MPRASFLIPVRNAQATLCAAIASAQRQTIRDIEILVVDDGSTDSSPEIAESLAEGDARIRVFRRPARGIADALDHGAREATSPYLARLDADDEAMPDRLEQQVPMLDADPFLAVVDGMLRFHPSSVEVPLGMRHYVEWIHRVVEPEDFRRQRFFESCVVHPAATIRRSSLLDVGSYRQGDFPEDFDLWLRLHAAGLRFRKIPRVVVTVRDSATRATRTDPRYRREAFRRLVEASLMREILDRKRRIVLWGGGQGGRPWYRFLAGIGQRPVAIVDVDPRKIGQRRDGSVPIVSPKELPDVDAELCFVAVGARSALDKIRAAIGELRPDWKEGEQWWALVCGKASSPRLVNEARKIRTQDSDGA